MTLPGFQPITPLEAPTYTGLLIQGTEQAVEISQAIEAAYEAGSITGGLTQMTNLPDNQPGWLVKLTANGNTYFGYQNDWLVLDSNNNLAIWHGTSPYATTNPQFASQYTTNTAMIWAATTTAPVATAQAGLTASIVFPQPISGNGPFNYVVTQTDTNTNTTGPAQLTGSPVVTNGSVALAVEGLVLGHGFMFTVVANTDYEGLFATALVTAPITATA